ncbi:HDOD domain-containing protein [Desulfuromonas acetoxidans]|uniref:Signal transduction protein n=1 Tax=Desulfuromonas acetoxidans (strain DSM 684 / 11070) TaxID=281689 RepID=Q1JVC1_DESA6|nr:HDOD domain-containing protein [Desulfuromonas acetoxidans]EAT14193.1 putative signal transduction protein [Desulfuromonas acetoxidans DSM 684]MBF0644849.1 HDOD domain-containing protein [Desulfuromonas acetoxidans]NVD23618.1 HDOD domain-containing protein [Desulfuromonas acetoxidans]NVE15997.1 HDOD domain-containing protein [Desulfuromonas acetoxidans]
MQDYSEIIGEVGDLPPMPIVAVKVLELLQDPDTSVKKLAETISLDSAVSARMLKIANSAMYGLSRQVTTLQNALVILGERTVRSLVLASSMSSVNKSFGLLEKMLWEESIGCALAARYFSSKLDHVNGEEAFMAGLFSNLGKIVRNNNDSERYQELVEAVYNGAGDYLTLEQEVFSNPYSLVGAAVLDSWKIAPLLVEVVHHQMDFDQVDIDNDIAGLSAVVNLSSAACQRLGIGQRQEDDEIDVATCPGATYFDLSDARVGELLEEFNEVFEQNRESFMG